MEDKGTAMAHYCANGQRRVPASLGNTTSVKEAELQAIKTAVESAEQEKHKSNIYVFTDSKEAVRELKKHDSRSKIVKSIKATARQLRAEGRTIKIRWIPGHQGIHGNDEAHAAAREQLQAVPPGQGSVHPVVDEDIGDDVDPTEIKAQERLERRQRLADLRRPDEHPLPSTSYSRWERVCLRRLRTGTAMTPALKYKFRKSNNGEDAETDMCDHCQILADIKHIIWDCPKSDIKRKLALNALPPQERPSCLREWVLRFFQTAHPSTEKQF